MVKLEVEIVVELGVEIVVKFGVEIVVKFGVELGVKSGIAGQMIRACAAGPGGAGVPSGVPGSCPNRLVIPII